MAINTFSNGLRLVCVSKPEKKVACVVLHIAGGTQSEKNYQSGISEYLTKIMLMGTKQHSTKATLMNYAKSKGIILTPHNSKESITFSAVVPRENIEDAIELLSELAFDTTFSLENGEKVRAQLMNQVSLLADNPQYAMDRLINTSLYFRTGLANPKSGTNITVSRFRSLDAKDYLEKVFTPRNTIISVVGDVVQDNIYELVKKYFFDRMKQSETEYKKLKYVSEVDNYVGEAKGRVKRLNQTRISVVFPTVSFKEKEKYILEIIQPILLDHIKLALQNQKYFFETKIKTKYYANNGNINFEIYVDYDYAVEHLYNFVRALAKDIKNREISYEEFETEKKVYITKFIDKYDGVLENALMSAKQVALTKQTFSEGTERLKMEILTNKDANKLIKKVLDFSKMLVVYLGHDINVDYADLLKQTK
ncbi:MAG: insulinase family protein [Clostridia bacterium]|nr:insulinase family protein [Clostridia bacterium]